MSIRKKTDTPGFVELLDLFGTDNFSRLLGALLILGGICKVAKVSGENMLLSQENHDYMNKEQLFIMTIMEEAYHDADS